MEDLRGFTVSPMWAFLIMNGVKDVENRRQAPLPLKGVAAVHVSKTFTRKEYEAYAEGFTAEQREQLPYEALASLCGRIVGIVDYEVKSSTRSRWWERIGKPIVLSNPRWVKDPFVPCRGALHFWHVPGDIAEKVFAMLEK